MIDILFLLLFFMSGAFNGIMDTLQHHYNKSIFIHKVFEPTFWDPKASWMNKYKERGDTKIANLIEKLDDGPLVFLTDGWHLMQMLWRVTLFSAILISRHTTEITLTGIWWIDILVSFTIISSVYLGSFVLFYNKFLTIK